MTPGEEQAFLQGERAAWTRVLQEARNALGRSDKPLADLAALTAEREQVIAVLRRLCEEHGDNDWDEDLHLADVVDKHLGRYLREAAEDEAAGRDPEVE